MKCINSLVSKNLYFINKLKFLDKSYQIFLNINYKQLLLLAMVDTCDAYLH